MKEISLNNRVIDKTEWQKLCSRLGARSATEVAQVKGPTYPTRIPDIDQLLGGGLPFGALSEIVAPKASCGGSLVLHLLIESTYLRSSYAALIDAKNSFAPDSIRDEAHLRHLYWARCRNTEDALRVCDILSSDRNFALVLIDLRKAEPASLNRIPSNRWYRLQRAMQKHGSTCVALTSQASIPAATIRLELHTQFSLDDLDRPSDHLVTAIKVKQLRGAIEATQRLA